MRSQKDSTKLKVILLIADILLALAVLAAAVGCGYYAYQIFAIPELNYDQTIQDLDTRLAETEKRIAEEKARPDYDFTPVAELEKTASDRLITAEALVADATAERDKVQQTLTDMQDPERMKLLIADLRTEYGQTVRQLEDLILAGESKYRICYLTFDDGPSYQTGKFLDELKELDAYATFFTIGCSIQDKRNTYIRDDYLRREAREGHTIANHTYSHAYYGALYKSVDNFMEQVKKQDELVYSVTGIHTDIVRFPSGSYYTPYRKGSIQALLDEGYQWMDWISNAFDAGGHGYSSSQIANTVIKQVRHDKITVVLMHDWNVSSLGALERIVTTLRKDNYLFLPLFKESTTNGNCYPKWDN